MFKAHIPQDNEAAVMALKVNPALCLEAVDKLLKSNIDVMDETELNYREQIRLAHVDYGKTRHTSFVVIMALLMAELEEYQVNKDDPTKRLPGETEVQYVTRMLRTFGAF